MLYKKVTDGVSYEQTVDASETERIKDLVANGWATEGRTGRQRAAADAQEASGAPLEQPADLSQIDPARLAAPTPLSDASTVQPGTGVVTGATVVHFLLGGQLCSAAFQDVPAALAWLGQVSSGAAQVSDIQLSGNVSNQVQG